MQVRNPAGTNNECYYGVVNYSRSHIACYGEKSTDRLKQHVASGDENNLLSTRLHLSV